VILEEVFKASAFCYRHRMVLLASGPLSVTLRVYRFNYKDTFDDFYDNGEGEEIALERLRVGPIDELVDVPTVGEVTISIEETSKRGQFRSEGFGFVPENSHQEVWVQVHEVRVKVNNVWVTQEDTSGVIIASKFRNGNMGFPQLDRMAQGGGYKGRRGFKKDTQWYSRLQYTFSRTKTSSSACPEACPTSTGSPLAFSTEVIFINDLDPKVSYTSPNSLEAVFKKHGWLCSEAMSGQGGETYDMPTENQCTRPPVWGSYGFGGAITDTTVSSSETQTESGIHVAVFTLSGIPTRNLYGSPQEDQDAMGDVFVQGADGCGYDNGLPCTATPKCSKAPYSNNNFPIWGYIADPFFGFNNVLTVEDVTMPLNISTTGYYGKVVINEDESFERPNEAIVSTANFAIPVPGTETYVTIRNIQILG